MDLDIAILITDIRTTEADGATQAGDIQVTIIQAEDTTAEEVIMNQANLLVVLVHITDHMLAQHLTATSDPLEAAPSLAAVARWQEMFPEHLDDLAMQPQPLLPLEKV